MFGTNIASLGGALSLQNEIAVKLRKNNDSVSRQRRSRPLIFDGLGAINLPDDNETEQTKSAYRDFVITVVSFLQRSALYSSSNTSARVIIRFQHHLSRTKDNRHLHLAVWYIGFMILDAIMRA